MATNTPIPLVDQLRERVRRSADDDVKLMTILRTLESYVSFSEPALRDAGMPQWLEQLACQVEDRQQLWEELTTKE